MATENITPPFERCATSERHQSLLATNSGYKARRQATEQFTLSDRETRTLRTGIAWIPVVVHVVHNTAGQNISDAQINSQIAVLNSDFNATNGDRRLVPPVFQPLVGIARIHYFLAGRDPQGRPTSGITRSHTTIVSFDHVGSKGEPDDRMKFENRGGANAWPSDRYLNIWVCQLHPNLGGYAEFPGAPPESDGIVITHTAFGTVGTAKAPYNLGRTTTHEVAHWLNIFHIWGNDKLGCSDTDYCDDTPNQNKANYGMPRFPHISCNNGPNGDLFMNFMDYTNDAGMLMFTECQVHRMAATLSGSRSSLVGSNFQEFFFQTGTALHNADDTFEFMVADWNDDRRQDLIAIKKSDTGTNTTEVHILSGATNFQEFILQTGTALHTTDDTFKFMVADWNGDRRQDLIAIKKSNTSTNTTEVHILSGATNFQEFILQTGTALHTTDDTFEFTIADWSGDGRPDLIAIKKSNTSTNTTEVHILSGATNFQEFILQTGTALHTTDDTFEFIIADWSGDGRLDLIAIKKSNTGTNTIEVHILSGATNFQEFILHTGTALHTTDKTFDFAMADWNSDGRPDLFAIKKSHTGTNTTEVHVLAG